jgi:hypothetical protein
MVQKVPFTSTSGNTMTIGTGTSRVIMGADSGNLKIQDSQSNTSIIEAGAGIVGASAITTYANSSIFPINPISSSGTLAYATLTSSLYISNGSGWYKISTLNTSPSISLSSTTASPSLNSLTLDFTYTVTEPEGTPTTTSIANSGIATVGNVAVTHTASNNHIRLVFDGTTEYSGDATVTLSVSDGVNTGTGTITITTAYYNGTNSRFDTLLMKATGTGNNTTPTDASASSHTLVMNGTASLGTFSPYKSSGYSMYFDGSGDYLTAPNSDEFTMTGAFTIEMWAYLDQTSYARTVQRLITPANSSPTSEPYISIGNDQGGVNAGCLCFTSSVAAGNPQGYATYEGTGATGTNRYFPFKQWVHIALTRDGSNVCRLFQDGVIVATVTISGGFDFNGANNGGISIAKSGWNTAEYFGPGYLADFRMVNGTAVYTANFTPPTERLTAISNTKLLLGAPGFFDKSSERHLMSVYGNSYIDSLSPYDLSDSYSASVHGGSATFPGASDEIKTSDGSSNAIGLGSGDFTVETWIYKNNAANSTWEALISQKYGSTGGWRIYKSASSGQVRWYAGSTDTLLSNTNNQLKQKAWCHVAMVRSSGTLTWYINGRASGTTSSHTYNYTGGGAEIEVGKGTVGSTYPTDANMTDVRIVNGTAVYTGDFTPPSGPLTTTGGTYPSTTNVNTSIPSGHTKLLLNMTQSKILDYSQHHTMHLTGAVASSTQQHFSENTLYIEDGDSDFVEISEEQTKKLTIYDDDYTVETWLYPTNFNASYNYFISKGTSPSAREWAFSISASDIRVYWSTNGSSSGDTTITGTVSNSLNQWVNLTFTKVGNMVSIYKNGTHITSGTFNSIYGGDAKLTIGRLWQYSGISHSYDGYIHDLRITKGATRYPFIPAKQTLTTTNSQRSGVTVTASNVTLLTCHTGSVGSTTITDGSSNSTSITRNGNAVVSDFAPATGMKSVFFDGTGDYLQCTLADTLGTADWTVEYWVWHNSISGNQIHCAFNGYAPAFYRRNSSNAFAVYHNGGVASPYYNTNITPVANKWYHMAYCHDDSEGKMTVFINGAQADEFTYSGNINGTTFRIGDDGTSAWMNGYISNLRIVKNTVVYTKNFTPATSALK